LLTSEPEAYSYARRIVDVYYRESAGHLQMIAYIIIDNEKLKSPDYELALSLAERANELEKNENPSVLFTLALAHFKLGHIGAEKFAWCS
jgi:hypothetical protein